MQERAKTAVKLHSGMKRTYPYTPETCFSEFRSELQTCKTHILHQDKLK